MNKSKKKYGMKWSLKRYTADGFTAADDDENLYSAYFRVSCAVQPRSGVVLSMRPQKIRAINAIHFLSMITDSLNSQVWLAIPFDATERKKPA